MVMNTTFVRHYPAELKSSAGFFIRARVLLSVSGPIDSETGMILNLVDFDRQAAGLISELENLHFESWQAVMAALESRWTELVRPCGLSVSRVALRAQGVTLESRWLLGSGWQRFWQVRCWIRPSRASGFFQLRVSQSGRLPGVKATVRQLASLLNQASFATPGDFLQVIQGLGKRVQANRTSPQGPFSVSVRDRRSGRTYRMVVD